jgi:N-acetylglucosaminyl-diphospho-decaprenol L-rhamnosyltransferase
MPQPAQISISVVSHQQIAMIANLLQDLQAHCTTAIEVILTLNVPEPVPFDCAQYRFPVTVIHNDHAQGFGTNHNAAFAMVRSNYFCVLNPDIRIENDPFPALLELLASPDVGVAAPLVVNPLGGVEDSARRFPTPLGILRKAVSKTRRVDYRISHEIVRPDWVAGMFMVFQAAVFRTVGGFDVKYFLYYEDVDLCWRLRRLGYDVAVQPAVRVIHAAQRASHRKLVYLRWHVASMLRFFMKQAFAKRTESRPAQDAA